MTPNKALLGLVIGLGVVILAMLGAVGYGLVQRASESKLFTAYSDAAAGPTEGPDLTVAIPPGSSVASVERSGELLMVHVVDEADRSTVLFVDPTDGRVVRRILFSTRMSAPSR